LGKPPLIRDLKLQHGQENGKMTRLQPFTFPFAYGALLLKNES